MAYPTDPEKDDRTVVPRSASRAERSHNALPVGTRLFEFELLGLIGEGGFGIVYLAQDLSLHRRVAVKEYMPASLASRAPDATAVCVRSQRHADTFDLGLRSFVNEARLLAQFDHPALLKVFRFWEANDTAYMAMPYYEGQTLREMLSAPTATPPDEAWIRRMLEPVMDALALMHTSHCYHRDVAPDNILVQPNGQPVLLDFGAARRVVGDATQALTVILKTGFAPIEQYAQGTGVEQGPWTDIYALGAVVHFIITGRPPPPSVARIVHDDYLPLASAAAGRYSSEFLQGIDRCLQVHGADRPQTMAQMHECLGLAADDEVTVAMTAEARPPPQPQPQAQAQARPHARAAAPAADPHLQGAFVHAVYQAAPVPAKDPPARNVALVAGVIAVFVTAAVVMVFPPQPEPKRALDPAAQTVSRGPTEPPTAHELPVEPTAAGQGSVPATATALPPLEPQAPAQTTAPTVPPPVATSEALPAPTPSPVKPRAAQPKRPARTTTSTPPPKPAAPTAEKPKPPDEPADGADKRRVEEQNKQLDELLQGK